MTTWRMSFRAGNHGHEMSYDCFRLGVAAITYGPLEKTDLSKHLKGQPKKLWAKLEPSQKASLRRVAYEMRAGDVIYVKRGPKIVNKGVVKGLHKCRAYKFDSTGRLKEPDGSPWPHQVPVKWVGFPDVRILLGSEQLTVKELSADKVKQLENAVNKVTKAKKRAEALEGKVSRAETLFRSRNRTLIQEKKGNSDYRCEVCEFSFDDNYRDIGRKYIVAHHLKAIASGPARTTLDDIALVCANCHAMIHTEYPPIKIEKMQKLVKRH